MENIVYNTVMSNLLISGTKACAVIPRELMSVDPAYQRLETRNHRKIKAMHDNFDHMIMDALLVVPHPEESTFSIVDGYGRFIASEGILDKLECVVITSAPSDPDERRHFEASIFTRQSLYTEKVTPLQMHKANLILGEPNAVALQEVVDEYNLSIAEDKGVRKPGTIGSYTSAYRIIKAKGKIAYESIISTCCKAGYNLSGDGLCDKIIRNLYKIYCFYGDIGLVKVLPIMRGTEPSTLKAKGIAAYPERVELSLALYLQDYLVSLGEPNSLTRKERKFLKQVCKKY